MPRLSDQAYKILAAEVRRLCTSPLEQVRADIVLRRLTRLRQADGAPATLEEMRQAVSDIFPEFSEQVLRQAARANGAAVVQRRLGCLGFTVAGLAALVGSVWVLNLPYPMIRWPVSKVAPIILLPSYMQMDHSYRQAISLVEQADQLVNQATSAQDIELGSVKVEQAQKHLDALPVWFLGYYPQRYCSLFSCSWRFTLDEFQAARKLIGRSEAVIFQEENALDLLETGTAEVDAAKQAYASAEPGAPQTQAIAAWQAGMDKLNEIPDQTLAGRMAATKLSAYERDYAQVATQLSGGTRSNILIAAAQSFALQAANASQGAPHSAATWERIADLWAKSIRQLEQVPVEDDGYVEAQRLVAEYTNNLGIIRERLAAEEAAVRALASAKDKTSRMLAQDLDRMAPNQIASQLQDIINDLEQVQPNTTAYPEARTMLQSAESKLKQLSS